MIYPTKWVRDCPCCGNQVLVTLSHVLPDGYNDSRGIISMYATDHVMRPALEFSWSKDETPAIKKYLLAHEHEIAIGENDFGDLEVTFLKVVGRAPVA